MKKGNRTWGTKDNGYIRVVDMTDSHLTNAFRMLYKQGRDRKTSYDYCYLQDEIGKLLGIEQEQQQTNVQVNVLNKLDNLKKDYNLDE